MKMMPHGSKSVFNSWLFSYLLLLLVPIAISSVVYVKAKDIIEVEVNRVNVAMLVQYQQEMDNGMPDIEEGKQDMLGIANEAQELIQRKFHLDFCISIGGIHATSVGISEAYQEALTVMEYKLTMEDPQVLCYDDLKMSKSSYNYPMETEYQLINCIKAGDFENASTIIHKVFKNNFTKAAFSRDMIRCLIFDLVGTILKIMPEIGLKSGNALLSETDIVNRLLGCEKVLEMKQSILEILKELCTGIQLNKRGKKDDLVAEVTKFIENSYPDVNFSVSSIALRFDITPNYLTTIFKDKTGDGLFEYITMVRLEKAKGLLKDQGFSIKDVAVKVGYRNSNVFIRAFKKYVGVTPGIYKEIS